MKRILVATDFSTRSDRATRRATLLAKRVQADLILAHVLDDDQPARKLKAEKREAEDLLSQLSLSINRDDGLSCSYRLAEGEAFFGILQTARDAQADLIVIGPHRRQLLQDIFVGTSAERIIRNSDIPVLMANGAPAGQYRRVMIATDLTPASADVVRQFQRLLTPHLHASEIMYAFPAPAQNQMRRAMLDEAAVGDYVAEEEDAAREGLAKFMREADVLDAKPVLQVNETKAAHTILAAATASNIDLLAIGVRSHTGLKKLLLGSTAENILASAQIDILAIPPG